MDILNGVESDKASPANAGVFINPVILERKGTIEGEEVPEFPRTVSEDPPGQTVRAGV